MFPSLSFRYLNILSFSSNKRGCQSCIKSQPYINQIWRDMSKTRLSSYQDISLNC